MILLASPGLAQQAEEEAAVVREEVVEVVGQGMQEVEAKLRRRKRRRQGWRKQPQR